MGWRCGTTTTATGSPGSCAGRPKTRAGTLLGRRPQVHQHRGLPRARRGGADARRPRRLDPSRPVVTRRRGRGPRPPAREPGRRTPGLAHVLGPPRPGRQDLLDRLLARPRGPARHVGLARPSPTRRSSAAQARKTPPYALVDEIRSACASVAARAQHVRIVEAAIEPYARRLPAESPPAPTSRARPRAARRVLADAERDQLRLGLVPHTEQAAPACPASARSRPGCGHGPWRVDELCALERRGRRHLRPGAGPRADGAVHARAARAGRARRADHGWASRRSRGPARARPGALAERWRVADVAGRLGLRRRAGAVLQARADRRRGPAPDRHRAGG